MAGDSTGTDSFGSMGYIFATQLQTLTTAGASPMVLLILLVLALFVMQTLLPGRFREPAPEGGKGKLTENLGNRDHMRPLTVVGERAARALANMHEALPVFLALALLNMIVGTAAGMAVTGATDVPHRPRRVRRYLHGGSAGGAHAWCGRWAGSASR